MANTLTSVKRTRIATVKAAGGDPGGFLPLVVDPTSMQILRAKPVATERQSGYTLVYESGGDGSQGYKVVIETAGKQAQTLNISTTHKLTQSRVGGQGAKNLNRQRVLRTLLEKTLASFEEVQGRHVGALSEDDMLREVGETLMDKATASTESPEEGWQELVERGLRSKTALLKSSDFKSTTQASKLVGVGEPAIRRRIRERKLFALNAPGDGEHRIPVWALDPGVAGAATKALYETSTGMDEWELHHFMTSPQGGLNGLRPFECLLSNAALSAAQRSARHELTEELELPLGASLLEMVCDELKSEIAEARA